MHLLYGVSGSQHKIANKCYHQLMKYLNCTINTWDKLVRYSRKLIIMRTELASISVLLIQTISIIILFKSRYDTT